MQSDEQAKRMQDLGKFPQFTMMLLYMSQLFLFEWTGGDTYYVWISHIGLGLFMYCLFTLYGKDKARLNNLITGGVFRFTRHPMYTGLFMMNLAFWLPEPASTEWYFFVLQALFLTCLVAAGWFQEKETLYRFGDEAQEYYRKTPRIFLFYPFVRSTSPS